ncbi:MAG: hypothetical protein PF447_08425 [Spirochaetaceae bacterium]|jgi:hypothetical protein|nr:hypothetical protein [Spirochaetaceae bacterium]
MKTLTILCVLMVLSQEITAQTCWYQSTTGQNTSILVYETYRNKEGELIDLFYHDSLSAENHHFELAADGSTREWLITHSDGTQRRFVREEDTLVVNESGETRAFDSAPWFGSIETGLSEMTRRGITDLDFWILDPDNLEVRKLSARVRGDEIIELNGESIEVLRIRVTVKGVPAIFYSVTFWFRESDGVFIQFEGRNGPPGTPLTATFLTKEETK